MGDPVGDPAEDRAPTAVAEHYRSVDSAPRRYALDRGPEAALGFLAVFTGLGLLVLLAEALAQDAGVLRGRDLVLAAAEGQRGAMVPMRLFLITFYAAFATSLATDVGRRLLLGGELVGVFLLACAGIDLVAVGLDRADLLTVPVAGQQVASALVALGVLPAALLRHSRLPDAVPLPPLRPDRRVRWHAWVRLAVPLALAFVVAAWVARRTVEEVAWLREWGLLGGVGPGVFLAQQVFVLLTGTIGLVLVRRSRRHVFAPPLAVLVPAHNEAHGIAATVAALDRAAARYDGPVHLYVVDNVSVDATVEVAHRALAECAHLHGEVLTCAEPGKAIALNLGLSRVREEFVVRIDADTLVGERCLDVVMRHFARPRVGAVGGLPLPTTHVGGIDRVRLVEVLVRHGLFQVSASGYDGVIAVPGMFVAYRRAALAEVGDLVQGMNGEDTDIGLRLDVAGYLTVADPAAVYRSETPRTWAHLREQRVRWFRSIYHVSAHNRYAIFDRHSMAGAVVLPFQLASAARRAMLAPILIFSVLVFGVYGVDFPGLHVEAVVATLLGMPMFVAAGACLRRPRALLGLPEYLVFRVVRSYLTVAAALTLVVPPLRSGPARGAWERRERGSGGI